MKLILVLFYSFITLFSFSQGIVPAGARSMSMGNASTTFSDVWAYHNNPGALATVEKFSVGLSYENRFLLKQLQSQGVAVAIPLKVGVLSFGGHLYGYSLYRSTKVGMGYSMKLSEKFFAGVQLNYQNLTIQNYQSKNTLTAEVGLFAKITDKWLLGVSVFNLGRAKLSDYQDDRFSTVFRLGSSYQFSKKLLFSGEFQKDLDSPLRFRAGLEYEVVDHFFVRGGFQSTPTEFTFGLGYHFKQIRLNVGSAYERIVGWSPHFSISFVGK